tara:strand:+ start:2546 stop:3250 length:705 start_codon:yes stop_codon:yes gene_type:complete
MIKKSLNQNAKYVQEIVGTVESQFIFSKIPINRINNSEKDQNKVEKLTDLKKKINSIENCNLKSNSKNLILGGGDIDSPIMLIGESPGLIEDNTSLTFQGDAGTLLKKMLLAINIQFEKTYSAYSVNFRPPGDRKPTSQEIKRYSVFLKQHVSIIDPKIIILFGGTAMEALTGYNGKISEQRGKWKEVILNNKTYPMMVTFSPSYLIRFPENKKYSWEDLKKIRKKIQDLKIKT